MFSSCEIVINNFKFYRIQQCFRESRRLGNLEFLLFIHIHAGVVISVCKYIWKIIINYYLNVIREFIPRTGLFLLCNKNSRIGITNTLLLHNVQGNLWNYVNVSRSSPFTKIIAVRIKDLSYYSPRIRYLRNRKKKTFNGVFLVKSFLYFGIL